MFFSVPCNGDINFETVSCYKQWLNCEKEVAESWKRGAEGAQTNAEGVRIEAPRGRGMGRGVPLLNRLRGLGERRELPQRGPGQSPGRKRFWCILWPLEGR